jgi:hypothetical protein
MWWCLWEECDPYTFSKVSAVVYLLYKVSTWRIFEHIDRSDAHGEGASFETPNALHRRWSSPSLIDSCELGESLLRRDDSLLDLPCP